jgi:uncharacterized membrane protein
LEWTDRWGVKAILSVIVYLALVVALGVVVAVTSRPQESDGPVTDDDF